MTKTKSNVMFWYCAGVIGSQKWLIKINYSPVTESFSTKQENKIIDYIESRLQFRSAMRGNP